jgi:hypothetical protein
MSRRDVLAAASILALGLLTGLLARPPQSVRLDAGGLVGNWLTAGWSESDRTGLDPEVAALDPPAAALGQAFRFRTLRPGGQIDLPFVAGGGVRLTLKALARVRTELAFHGVGPAPVQVVIPKGPWAEYTVELPGPEPRATLALEAQPLVRVPDELVARPQVAVAEIALRSPGRLAFSPGARLLLAAAPLAVGGFGLVVGLGPAVSGAAALAAALAVLGLGFTAPFPVLLAIPRLLFPALAAGLLASRFLPAPVRPALAALVAAGILYHGALPFVPGHDPYDLEVHVRRARDLGSVPFEYQALLRYGSHLPTVSQTFGTATAALGEAKLIPYSPLAYLPFYALHWLGADLHWCMTVLNVVLLMLVGAGLWLAAARIWDPGSAFVAVLLYTLDLPLWHHVGSAHTPASFGIALALAALLYLACQAQHLDSPRRIALAGLVLGVAALGYSSSSVLFGLFGVSLLALLAADAAALSPAAKRGLVLALGLGGLLAGALFYFHYLPGLLTPGPAVQTEQDLFPGRTYLIFHNESRQAMRVWAGGWALPLGAGLLLAPLALRRALPTARPILVAWLCTWALTMLLKEPYLLPRPLRWAKEDQLVGPLLALVIGASCWGLPRPWMRWSAAILAVAIALRLQIGDFLGHLTP